MNTETTASTKHHIGFALSGGFIKGFAHLGAIQSLYEHDIRPDIISGTSAGALVGAFLADGHEPYRVLDYFAGHKFQDLTKLVIPKRGLFELSEFVEFLEMHIRTKRLEALPLPLIVAATDLDHGQITYFRTGNLAIRVAASCSMPALFTPINIEGTNYVDGGIFMNLPVSVIRRECERVVAINVSPLEATEYKLNIVNIATRAYNFMSRANAVPQREMADLLVEPYNLRGYSNRELEKAEEIFNQGYNTANETLSRLKETGNIWKN